MSLFIEYCAVCGHELENKSVHGMAYCPYCKKKTLVRVKQNHEAWAKLAAMSDDDPRKWDIKNFR